MSSHLLFLMPYNNPNLPSILGLLLQSKMPELEEGYESDDGRHLSKKELLVSPALFVLHFI